LKIDGSFALPDYKEEDKYYNLNNVDTVINYLNHAL